jgi:hypothetical protein
MGLIFAVSFMNLMFASPGGMAPKGGLRRLAAGMGRGMGILVMEFWMYTTGRVDLEAS